MSSTNPTETEAHASGLVAKARRRARTAVACRRCKSRKQKCDGVTPSCSNCSDSDSVCHYDFGVSLNRSHEQYVRARRRVEELERVLERLLPEAPQAEADSAPPPRTSASPTIASSAQAQSGQVRNAGTTDDALKRLSLQAGGGYVGTSTTDTFGRLLQAFASTDGDSHHRVTQPGLLDDNLAPKSLEIALQPTNQSPISLLGIPDIIADRIMERGYRNHLAILWPVMQPQCLNKLHKERAQLQNPSDIAVLHLVYATAGRYLETTGETGSFRSEKHYQAAVASLGEIPTFNASVITVQVLLLLAIYSLRAPRGPGAWSFVGMAMRMCVELGLHRKRKEVSLEDSEHEDVRRRVFWSCYCLDRQVSIILGRPFAVADRDIDAELPVGVDEEDRESMTCFRRMCRLRIIESHIQQAVYRVDVPLDSEATNLETQKYLCQLDAWKSKIPSAASGSRAIDTSESYLIYYYQAVRFLLHPHILSSVVREEHLLRTVQSCGGICQTYKRLHQNVSVGFSLMALHSVFFAGLTILYCAWQSPGLVLTASTRNMIHDCSIVLYIITERWPAAKRYRDMFDAIQEPLLQTIDQHQGKPRTAIPLIQPDLRNVLKSMGETDFSTMLRDMTGEPPNPGPVSETSSVAASAATPFDMMPRLAFDFSLPTEPHDLATHHDQFDPVTGQWYQNQGGTNESWMAELSDPYSMSI